MRLFASICVAAAMATASYGNLILLSPTQISGTGLGAVNTVLTVNGVANNTLETGCVGVSGGATTTAGCGFPNSSVQAQFGTPTLQALAIASAADLRIIFNASEPGNALDIQLNQLALTLYNASGSASATFTTAAPIYFPTTASGTGNSGYLFGLDAPQALIAQTFINNNGGTSSVRVGLGASIGCGTNTGQPTVNCIGPNPTGAGSGQATGGLETFFVTNAASTGGPGAEIPEPTTMLLLGGGLTLLGLSRRFTR